MLLQEQNEKGATVFLSSHILNEIERYCKRAAVIRDGRILVCDQVDRLGHTGVKRVCLRGAHNFAAWEDVKDVKTERDALTFLYSGDQRDLLQRLTKVEFQDISITDPELEEIILHYYIREGERIDGILS